jgi:hypothetical protein
MKSVFIMIEIIVLFSCTAPVRHYISPPEDKDTSATTSQIVPEKNVPTSIAQKSLPPLFLPIAEWIGKKFYILPKQELIRATGYNLYSCKPGACDSSVYPSDWELKNHRIRCENISGETLTVTAVEPVNNEWIISFVHSRTGRQIYGHTNQHALQEIVLSDDLSHARERWLSTAVFSKRGVISTLGTNSTRSISSLRVNIFDSLIVNDVQWGMTPLPVKPIWLIVSSSSGKSGFIPVRFSWTNTLADRITNQLPWEEDIFEYDPRSIYNWEEYIWEVINNHRVILEMTLDQVSLSWGAPDSIKKNAGETESERWIYPSHECLFTKGKLALISERNR